MSEMVERVLEAIDLAEARLLDGEGRESVARAAIEAMREPTEAMLKAADSSTEPEPEPWPVDIAWRAMIDEALK